MAQPFFKNLPLAYHTMMSSCKAWAHGQYSGLQGKVFDGTAVRPRRDLLLWSAAAEGLDPSAAAVADGVPAHAAGNGKPALKL